MQPPESQKELAGKTARFLNAEMRRPGKTYGELAERLKKNGLEETVVSMTSRLARETFAATFLLAVVADVDLDGVRPGNL